MYSRHSRQRILRCSILRYCLMRRIQKIVSNSSASRSHSILQRAISASARCFSSSALIRSECLASQMSQGSVRKDPRLLREGNQTESHTSGARHR